MDVILPPVNDNNWSILSGQLAVPLLVVEALLDKLDIFELKTLRLLSKTTKEWVETPEVLRLFPVCITGESRMLKVLSPESEVPWNSFIFSKKYKCVSDSDIKKFLVKYGELVRVLEFKWPQEKMQHELKILSGCVNLESITSNQLCLETILPDILTKNLLNNFKNLKHFHVQRFRGGPCSPLMEMQFFEQILNTCVQLKTVTIPQFSYEFMPLQGFDYVESFTKHVISPLITYINTGRLREVTAPYYGLTEDVFLKLSKACKKTDTVLLNVRSSFLKSLPIEELEVLDIIGSLDGATDTIIRASLANVRNVCFVNPSFNIDDNSYPVPHLPNLTNVEIDFKFSRKSQKSMELFVHRLGKVRRPTVKTLKITYQPGPPVVFPIHISPVDLLSSFVNLRVLHVKDWDGDDEQFIALWGLATNLIELSLINCRKLTDRGILGDNPDAAILQLQHLKKLSIINYLYVDQGVVNITEMSFIHAFRHMPLRAFHFFEGNLLLSNKSIPRTAIEALWNGIFGSTIEDLVIQETDLENCDMILKRKLECSSSVGKRENKRKYSDHFFRSSNRPCTNFTPTATPSHHIGPGCSIV